ncbi:hypothetical protein SHKM778_81450 [Streptomyces sp. KM77-8]|uniref:Uncharacterized protein n=1 Tax=Streptomyces haneummycinicus TaxID=3074435 RepID=A0AAT9HW73_9ACTN
MPLKGRALPSRWEGPTHGVESRGDAVPCLWETGSAGRWGLVAQFPAPLKGRALHCRWIGPARAAEPHSDTGPRP